MPSIKGRACDRYGLFLVAEELQMVEAWLLDRSSPLARGILSKRTSTIMSRHDSQSEM